ncbi:hypothetical protein N7445_004390 [Penicillium cf. griseofulvum]|nr:hypothetical protein N7445_004390 [Penicillium cf. griseofulvum]
MPTVLRLYGDLSQEELDLEMSGDIASLQRYRLYHWLEVYHNKNPADMVSLLRTELKLRENTQREMALTEDIQELQKSPTHGISTRIRVLRLPSELSELSKQYWMLERDWWKIRRSFINGLLTRGIDFWRSHPRWYMHSVLCKDCAGRGGCCERDCGCCSNRTWRKFSVGHCTVECSCCEKARGFKHGAKEKAQIQEAFKLGGGGSYHRIRNAALLGLLSGSWEHPLDHVRDDPSPRYKP